MTTTASSDELGLGRNSTKNDSALGERLVPSRSAMFANGSLSDGISIGRTNHKSEGWQREYDPTYSNNYQLELFSRPSIQPPGGEQVGMLRLVLLRLFESYFRHRWLNLIPLGLMLIAAVVYGVLSFLYPTYTARSAFYVQAQPLVDSLTTGQQDSFSWVSPADQTISNIREVLQTDAFVTAVVEKTDLQPKLIQRESAERVLDEVRHSIGLYSIGNNLIGITCNHKQSQVALQISTNMIETYIQWKINDKLQESTVAQAFLQDTVQSYQRDLDATREALKAYYITNPDPQQGNRPSVQLLQISVLQNNIDLASKRLLDAQNKEESAHLSASVAESNVRQKYQVIDAANLPDQPEVSPRQMLINLAIFIVVGVLLSGIAILGGALLDNTFRVPLDVRHGLDLKVLAVIPDTAAKKKSKRRFIFRKT